MFTEGGNQHCDGLEILAVLDTRPRTMNLGGVRARASSIACPLLRVSWGSAGHCHSLAL